MLKLILPLALILLLVGFNSFYVLVESDQAIITQFGKPVGGAIDTPGLHFKLPVVQKVHRFEKRFLEWDGDPNQLPTRDKRFIWVNNYARWRITDPLLFFQRVTNELGAQTRLDDIIDGETRNAIASYDLVEVVRNINRDAVQSEGVPEDDVILSSIAHGRDVIRQEILKNARERTQDMGIEILDVEFKRINYVTEVQRKVYERMISERQRIAERFRSEGQGEASRIKGEKVRELLNIRSKAYREVQEIKGKADASATNIYAGAYDRSLETRSFYAFLKSMESYKTTLGKKNTLIMSTEADYYRYLKRSDGK
jgi:modulator of FtsH protease HflC